MSGDLEREGDDARRPDGRPAVERSVPETGRPDFLPPSGGHPRLGQALVPPAQPLVPSVEPPAPRTPFWAGTLWNVGVLVAAAVLLVSAFLPWVAARVVLSAFGQTMTRDLGSATGLDADGMIAAIPVLALAALGMAFWGLITGDPRVSSLTAVPGGMALVTSGIFLMRLDETRHQLVGPDTPFGYEIVPAYGWYLAVAASLLVLGFGLARPVVARVSSSQPAARPAPPRPPQPPQPQWYDARPPAPEPAAEQPVARPDAPGAEQKQAAEPQETQQKQAAEPEEPGPEPKPGTADEPNKTDQPGKKGEPGKSATWSPP
ncbi:hypothetical protein [Actinomadura miaoliensis]|uniref:hypothetical protein n=1 Tax=Actinomadura miaoliensis TaxID=430685 RepID=UPI0031E69799